MSWGQRVGPRAAAWALCLAAASLLAACATPGPASTGPGSGGEARDHVTASDESESGRRGRVRMELAAAYFGRGQMTTALDEVKLAIAANPNLAAAFNLRGLIYASLGDNRLAEESFRHALQLDPRDADAMQNFGWYLCQEKRFDEADALFRRALAIPQYRDSQRTLLTQGVCQARAGQWLQAEGTLTRANELDPGNPVVAVNLSEVLYHRGEYERARFHIRRVNGIPDVVSAQTLWLAARIERRLGNRQGVEQLGTQLRHRFPESPESAAFERGQFDE
ncbi:type IV pilus biogenesis/stability protein PilW [Piscinibacter sp.]|uniref:type IV pilus biogenesis/stability protein PilW n=1 Tax=Piscinibacter sp. TaxID=1903157 RepID=UPI002C9AD48F|nr:type IV pilus biogenesis/stability protein PilW [Albitalea sp.]HUG26514.1 type IV pilus biogenesis/stability protein PilW [Albitalea sp.]